MGPRTERPAPKSPMPGRAARGICNLPRDSRAGCTLQRGTIGAPARTPRVVTDTEGLGDRQASRRTAAGESGCSSRSRRRPLRRAPHGGAPYAAGAPTAPAHTRFPADSGTSRRARSTSAERRLYRRRVANREGPTQKGRLGRRLRRRRPPPAPAPAGHPAAQDERPALVFLRPRARLPLCGRSRRSGRARWPAVGGSRGALRPRTAPPSDRRALSRLND